MSTYDDARIALDLAFKATDPERKQAGIDWLRQIVDGLPETRPLTPVQTPRPYALPGTPRKQPKGYAMYGKGPLRTTRASVLEAFDVVHWSETCGGWVSAMGISDSFIYALRKGSEIARLNGP